MSNLCVQSEWSRTKSSYSDEQEAVKVLREYIPSGLHLNSRGVAPYFSGTGNPLTPSKARSVPLRQDILIFCN